MTPKEKNDDDDKVNKSKNKPSFSNLGEARNALQDFIDAREDEVDHIDDDGNEILRGDIFDPDDPSDTSIVDKFAKDNNLNDTQISKVSESLWGKGEDGKPVNPLVSSSDVAQQFQQQFQQKWDDAAPERRQNDLLSSIRQEQKNRESILDRPSQIGRYQELQDNPFGSSTDRRQLSSRKTQYKRAVREAKRMGVNPNDPKVLNMLMSESGIDNEEKRGRRSDIGRHILDRREEDLQARRRGVNQAHKNIGASILDDSDPTRASDIAGLFDDDEEDEGYTKKSNIAKAGSRESKIKRAGSPDSNIKQSSRNRTQR